MKTKMKKFNNKKGYSLVELIVVVAILLVLASLSSGTLITAYKARGKSAATKLESMVTRSKINALSGRKNKLVLKFDEEKQEYVALLYDWVYLYSTNEETTTAAPQTTEPESTTAQETTTDEETTTSVASIVEGYWSDEPYEEQTIANKNALIFAGQKNLKSENEGVVLVFNSSKGSLDTAMFLSEFDEMNKEADKTTPVGEDDEEEEPKEYNKLALVSGGKAEILVSYGTAQNVVIYDKTGSIVIETVS